MNPFTRFINSPLGRVVRIVGGAAMMGVGVAVRGDSGLLLAALGLIPLAAGLFDICLMAPIFRIPWRGAKIRAMQ